MLLSSLNFNINYYFSHCKLTLFYNEILKIPPTRPHASISLQHPSISLQHPRGMMVLINKDSLLIMYKVNISLPHVMLTRVSWRNSIRHYIVWKNLACVSSLSIGLQSHHVKQTLRRFSREQESGHIYASEFFWQILSDRSYF